MFRSKSISNILGIAHTLHALNLQMNLWLVWEGSIEQSFYGRQNGLILINNLKVKSKMTGWMIQKTMLICQIKLSHASRSPKNNNSSIKFKMKGTNLWPLSHGWEQLNNLPISIQNKQLINLMHSLYYNMFRDIGLKTADKIYFGAMIEQLSIMRLLCSYIMIFKRTSKLYWTLIKMIFYLQITTRVPIKF